MAEEPRDTREADVCIRCGYELRGLAADSLCPECALPVARSLERSPLLRGADREWLAGVHAGAGRLHRAARILLGFVVGLLVIVILAVAADAVGVRVPIRLPDPLVRVLASGLMAVVAWLHIIGCWRIAAPTHGGYAPPAWARLGVRICGIALPITVGLTVIVGGLMRGLPRPAQIATHVAFQFNALLFFFALAAVLEHLERRTPGWDDSLRRRHRNVRKNLWGVAILAALFYWAGRRGGGGGDWGLAVFGIAYLCMDGAIARVRRAVGLEWAVGDSRPVLLSARDEDADAVAAGIGGAG